MVYVHVTVYSGQKCKCNNLNFKLFIESALLDKRDLYILVTDTCNCTSL